MILDSINADEGRSGEDLASAGTLVRREAAGAAAELETCPTSSV